MKYGLRGEPWEGRPIASTRAAFAVIVAVGLSAAMLLGQGDLAAIHLDNFMAGRSDPAQKSSQVIEC